MQKYTSAASVSEPPVDILCPITCQIMNDPVLLVASGNTYESEAILEWLENNDTDPLTGEKIIDKTVTLNKMAKRIISTILEETPEFINDVYFSNRLIQELLSALEKNEINTFTHALNKDSRLLNKNLKGNKKSK